jgi:GT2 family glycosyltransferase
MHPETPPPAPAVVAVVVTCDPGPWFEEALDSLALQDYPNLSVLVIDSASTTDPTTLVASRLPEAFVSRLTQRVGFGRAANEVLKIVEGASHLLLCHDDVVLAPDAIRALVEEAFRQNAGIATPKYVEWDRPERLLAVGATADKVGVVQDLVEPGELDQEQHDVVREVFVAPGGVTLVRADLFRALGGFNATIDQFGEDLDLSWRARVAGARVVAVPGARVRHLQALRLGQRAGWATPSDRRRAERLAEEHRLRTLLTCYRWFELAWIAPLAVLFILGEAATRLLQGRPGDAAQAVAALAGGWRRPARLWRSRRRVQSRRRTGDREIRHLQARGNARFRAFVRARVDDVREGLPPAPVAIGGDDDDILRARRRRSGTQFGPGLAARVGATRARLYGGPGRPGGAGPSIVMPGETPAAGAALTGASLGGGADAVDPSLEAVTSGVSATRRVTAAAALIVIAILVFGSRSLFGHELPAIGQLPNMSGGWSGLWQSFWATWQRGGLGVAAPSTPALGLLGLFGTVLFGAVGTLQHVVVLGPLLLGPLGAYRAARWWGSRRGRLAALIAYAIVPLPYNALARGHWSGLVAYAAAPWILGLLIRLSGEIPLPITRTGRTGGRMVGLALLVAVTAAFVPSWLFVVPIMGLTLMAGSALAGRRAHGLRLVAVAVLASVVATVLLLPWSATVLGHGTAVLGVGSGPAGRLGLGQTIRFDTGPVGQGPLGWALLAAAALPLVIGRDWRLAWATRMWVVAIGFFWITWAGSHGWVPALPPEVGLAPAAAALAGSVALGAVAFELDLPGYRFGWRQLAAGVAGVALAIAAVPMLIASGGGRWDLPSADASNVLGFLPDSHTGDYRVLWVGAPDAVPLAGQSLGSGIAYAASYDGEPTVADQWAPGRTGAMPALAADLRLVEARLTTKLGHLLAPMAIRYLVIPSANAPSGTGAASVATPSALLAGLQLQTDLQLLNVDPNYVVYQNSAWAPARAVLPSSAVAVASASAASGLRPLQQTDLTGASPVLSGGSPTRTSGTVPLNPKGPTEVYVAATRQGGWRLQVAGAAPLSPHPAFGWAMAFTVPPTATAAHAVPATLVQPAPTATRVLQIVEIVLWLAALAVAALDLRRRRSEHPPTETVQAEWFVPMAPARDRGRWQPGGAGSLGADDMTGDEVWIDV